MAESAEMTVSIRLSLVQRAQIRILPIHHPHTLAACSYRGLYDTFAVAAITLTSPIQGGDSWPLETATVIAGGLSRGDTIVRSRWDRWRS